MSIDAVFDRYPQLLTNRFVLRQVEPGDANALFAIKSDAELTGRYGAKPHLSIDETRKWIDLLIRDYAERKTITWCITFKGQREPIGSCVLWHLNLSSLMAEIGYELNRAYWGRGIIYEALTAILNWAFSEMGLNRIEACPLDKNTPSKDLLQKLGFSYEGRLKERTRFEGKFEDQLYYALLKSDWPGILK